MIFSTEEFQTILRQFNGSEIWHRHPLLQDFTFTEGVYFVIEQGQAGWLVDLVFFCQYDIPALQNEAFQIWEITTGHDGRFSLACKGADGKEVHSETLPRRDLPLENIKFYFKNSVLMLPGEY